MYLMVALQMSNESHFPTLSEFKEKYPEADISDKMRRLL